MNPPDPAPFPTYSLPPIKTIVRICSKKLVVVVDTLFSMTSATPLSIHVWTDPDIGRWMIMARLFLPPRSLVLNTGHGYRSSDGAVSVGVSMIGGILAT